MLLKGTSLVQDLGIFPAEKKNSDRKPSKIPSFHIWWQPWHPGVLGFPSNLPSHAKPRKIPSFLIWYCVHWGYPEKYPLTHSLTRETKKNSLLSIFGKSHRTKQSFLWSARALQGPIPSDGCDRTRARPGPQHIWSCCGPENLGPQHDVGKYYGRALVLRPENSNSVKNSTLPVCWRAPNGEGNWWQQGSFKAQSFPNAKNPLANENKGNPLPPYLVRRARFSGRKNITHS